MASTAKTEDPRIERTRQVVLEAAAELVAECGFGRTTIEAIAERSGVARSTIYRHWPQRPDLLIEAVKCHVGTMPEPDTGVLRDDLFTILGALAGWLADPQLGAMAASLMAEAQRDRRFAEVHTGFTRERRRSIEDVIRLAVDRAEIPATVDPEQMAQDLVAPIFYRAMVTHDPLDDEFVRTHVDRWMEIHTGC